MTDTYRPGDIAMVTGVALGSKPAPAVCLGGYMGDQTTWHFLTGGWTNHPAEVGPVLGNVADIAAAETERIEDAKHEAQDCCGGCGSDHIYVSFTDPEKSNVTACTGCTCKEAP